MVDSRECPFCLSKIPIKATRCLACTSEVKPAVAELRRQSEPDMNRSGIASVFIVAALVAVAAGQAPKPDPSKFLTQPLVKDLYTADPSAHVFNGKIFIYPSHDIDAGVPADDLGSHFAMRDYHVFSMDAVGGKVTDHGVALDIRNVPWAGRQMWAPDAAEKGGKVLPVLSGQGQAGRVPHRRGGRQQSGRTVHGASPNPSRAVTASTRPCSRTPTGSTTCTSAASGADSCSGGRAAPTRRRTRIRRRTSRRSAPRSRASATTC